jgi:Na+/phosphate symporter
MKIASKDDYIDNLKSVVEKKCFPRLAEDETAEPEDLNILRAIHIMAVNLERIGDFCVNISPDRRDISHPSVLFTGAGIPGHDRHRLSTLSRVMPVFQNTGSFRRPEICRSEYHLDQNVQGTL